jgi:hypothetical protein
LVPPHAGFGETVTDVTACALLFWSAIRENKKLRPVSKKNLNGVNKVTFEIVYNSLEGVRNEDLPFLW